jgi:hypothetical protein
VIGGFMNEIILSHFSKLTFNKYFIKLVGKDRNGQSWVIGNKSNKYYYDPSCKRFYPDYDESVFTLEHCINIIRELGEQI